MSQIVRSPLQSEMNRLLTSFFDTPTGRTGAVKRWVPAMDLVETADAYVLRADLPGVAEADVSVQLEDGLLTVAGQRESTTKDEREGYMRLERSTGSFQRSLRLPDGVDAGAVTASFDQGVLEVRVPKPEQIKPQKVEIAIGRGEATPAAEAETEDA